MSKREGWVKGGCWVYRSGAGGSALDRLLQLHCEICCPTDSVCPSSVCMVGCKRCRRFEWCWLLAAHSALLMA
jgi:hypothetical protein